MRDSDKGQYSYCGKFLLSMAFISSGWMMCRVSGTERTVTVNFVKRDDQ